MIPLQGTYQAYGDTPLSINPVTVTVPTGAQLKVEVLGALQDDCTYNTPLNTIMTTGYGDHLIYGVSKVIPQSSQNVVLNVNSTNDLLRVTAADSQEQCNVDPNFLLILVPGSQFTASTYRMLDPETGVIFGFGRSPSATHVQFKCTYAPPIRFYFGESWTADSSYLCVHNITTIDDPQIGQFRIPNPPPAQSDRCSW